MLNEIKRIISEWNPIEVPEDVALHEYGYLVNGLLKIGADMEQLRIFLIFHFTETMGFELTESSKQDINEIVTQVYELLEQ